MEGDYIRQATVSPHWLPNSDAFWYRLESAPSKFEFIFVDPSKQIRQPAFNHAKLANLLSAHTEQNVDPDSLPFSWVEVAPDSSWVRFRFQQKVWQYDSSDTLLEWEGEFSKGNLLRFAKEVPSTNSREETSVTFVNHTWGPLAIFWIDWEGNSVPYGMVEVGGLKEQSTFVGHVWRLVDRESGKVKAIYTAVEGDSMAVVDDLMLNDTVIEGGEVNLEGEDEKKKLRANEPESENSESNEESQQQDSKDSKEPASTSKIETTEAGFKLSIRDFNIWLSKPSGGEIQISTNGTASNPYDATRIYPSPTGHFAVIWQYMPAQEHFLNLIESSPKDQLQPKLKSIQYLKPGDRVRINRPRLFDLERGCEIETDDELFRNPYKVKDIGWRNNEEYCFIFNGRGHKYIRILGVNLKGVVRSIVEEKSETFIDYSSKWKMRFMRESNEVLWMSERDGWNHLYLFDVEKGRLKNRVTEGEWVVRSVASVDEERRRIWMTGFGMVKGQDPYYAHLASVNFDGSGFTILTEGDGTHTWRWSPSRRFFIDMWSRVDYPPETVLREAETGKLIMGLEKCELNALLDAGWDAPERFEAPGRDGETLIYGIIIRPTEFDPSKKYPILEDIYAGPQDFHTPKAFSSSVHQRKWADQGYIVVLLDGMGTNWRSKAFHDICYKNLKDAGLPDRIAWIKAAAKTRPWMDISRVGIRGTSAGGQNAVAALLFHGNFYKAGIADSGCHDNRMDKIWWNEQWMGYPVDKSYEESSNVVHAGKLKGALMLIVGELDDNVDPSSTMQLVHALNEADKDYELLFITGGGHGAGSSPYGMRRKGDFFGRHLQGGELVQHNAS